MKYRLLFRLDWDTIGWVELYISEKIYTYDIDIIHILTIKVKPLEPQWKWFIPLCIINLI